MIRVYTSLLQVLVGKGHDLTPSHIHQPHYTGLSEQHRHQQHLGGEGEKKVEGRRGNEEWRREQKWQGGDTEGKINGEKEQRCENNYNNNNKTDKMMAVYDQCARSWLL